MRGGIPFRIIDIRTPDVEDRVLKVGGKEAPGGSSGAYVGRIYDEHDYVGVIVVTEGFVLGVMVCDLVQKKLRGGGR